MPLGVDPALGVHAPRFQVLVMVEVLVLVRIAGLSAVAVLWVSCCLLPVMVGGHAERALFAVPYSDGCLPSLSSTYVPEGWFVFPSLHWNTPIWTPIWMQNRFGVTCLQMILKQKMVVDRVYANVWGFGSSTNERSKSRHLS